MKLENNKKVYQDEIKNDKGNVVEIAMGRKGSSKANVQKEREIKVREMLDSPYWKQLEVA